LEGIGLKVTIITYFKPEVSFAKANLKGLTVKDGGEIFTKDERIDWQPWGLIKYYRHLIRVVKTLSALVKEGDYDVLNPHEWLAQYAAVDYKKYHPQTRVVWMCNDVWHIPDASEEGKERRLLFDWAKRLWAVFDRHKTQKVDVITVLDKRIQKICRKFYQGVKVKVVRSGIDILQAEKSITKEKARRELGINQESYVVLCFSIFYKHRRFEDVVRAVAQLVTKENKKRIRLIIVGSDAQDKEYAKLIKQLVIQYKLEERVWIVNKFVDEREKQVFLRAADLFAYPNNNQTWGLIVIEAMWHKLPCIVSTGAGVHEIIEDGINGMIYPVKNWLKLAGKIKEAMANKVKVGKMGIRAHEYVQENLSWRKYALAMEAVLIPGKKS